VGDWTDIPPAELLSVMRGSAPVSAGASDELERLIAALKQDWEARDLLHAGDEPAEVLERLRAMHGETGEAVSGYLDLVGYRLLDGFDISGRYALELPDALIRAIRASVDRGPDESEGEDRAAYLARLVEVMKEELALRLKYAGVESGRDRLGHGDQLLRPGHPLRTGRCPGPIVPPWRGSSTPSSKSDGGCP
jgi:hypothetical protein